MVLGRVLEVDSTWFLASLIFDEDTLQKYLYLQVDHMFIWQLIHILSI